MESVILRTENLQVGYGQKVVVGAFNLNIARGQFIGLLGPNGCGKSTIIKTVVRMLAPLGGSVYIAGNELFRIGQNDLARQLSVVLTERPATGLLTAFDVASLGRYPHTGFFGQLGEEDVSKTWQALRQVGAEHLAERFFAELSDGEKQKVLLARALAQEPELIVLDEPTSHLDTHHRIEVMLILRQLVREQGVTIVASLHDVDLALKVCDTTVLVKDGGVLASGPPEDVLDEENVARLYGLSRASFSSLLGGVELLAEALGPVFVVAGAGSGSVFYRALVKHGLGFATGVLAEGEVDLHVARSMGVKAVISPAYEPPSPAVLAEAVALLEQAEVVVDAGFPTGSLNRYNVDLLLLAAERNKKVHTMRDYESVQLVFGGLASKVIRHGSLASLLQSIRARGTCRETAAATPLLVPPPELRGGDGRLVAGRGR